MSFGDAEEAEILTSVCTYARREGKFVSGGVSFYVCSP